MIEPRSSVPPNPEPPDLLGIVKQRRGRAWIYVTTLLVLVAAAVAAAIFA